MRTNRHAWRALVLICGFIPLSHQVAQAQTLEEAVQAARKVDAQYAVQQAGVQSLRAQARQSATAYWPTAGIIYNRADASIGGVNNKAISLTQPLINYDKYLVVQQADPQQGLADATARQADIDMVLRVFSAMAEIVRQREALRSNEAQAKGLQEQLRGAQRMHELGQGTVTEVSDFEARVAATQANHVALQNALDTAVRQFRQLTGLEPELSAISVERPRGALSEMTLPELTSWVREHAPTVQQARHNLELAQIAAKRVRAQYVPQVYAQVAHTKYASNPANSINTVGIALTATLGAPQYYEDQRVNYEVLKAQENLRYAQEVTVSELVRLFSSAQALHFEVSARDQAVMAARQAVEANIKSYRGGVKTNTDVLISYQNLSDAEMLAMNSRLLENESIIRISLLINK
jgi:protease secretion system outer membrane protein